MENRKIIVAFADSYQRKGGDGRHHLSLNTNNRVLLAYLWIHIFSTVSTLEPRAHMPIEEASHIRHKHTLSPAPLFSTPGNLSRRLYPGIKSRSISRLHNLSAAPVNSDCGLSGTRSAARPLQVFLFFLLPCLLTSERARTCVEHMRRRVNVYFGCLYVLPNPAVDDLEAQCGTAEQGPLAVTVTAHVHSLL